MADFDELKSHQEMWRNFIKLVGFTAVASAVSLVLMAIFLL